MWAQGTKGQGRTNPFAAVRGDMTVIQPLVNILHHLLLLLDKLEGRSVERIPPHRP